MLNTVVVVVEGMGVSLLGSYGANLARTPMLDQLATQGVVLDQCFLDTCKFEEQLQSLWTGVHAAQNLDAATSIFKHCDQAGVESCLLSDCEQVATWAEQAGCKNAMFVSSKRNESPVENWEDSRCLQLFQAAGEELSHRNGLVWIHSRGLRLEWDAPLELRQAFIDPEDPDPPGEVGPPSFSIDKSTDPDLVVGWGQVANAQMAMIDDAFATLAAAIAGRDDAETWSWAILGLGGTPLGEHHRVGFDSNEASGDQQLYLEELAVPTLLLPRARPDLTLSRRNELFQLPDVSATILGQTLSSEIASNMQPQIWGEDILSLPLSDTPRKWKACFQRAWIDTADQNWLRVPAWSSHLHQEDERLPTLFVKPEDRWEVSDIADRRTDIVELMQQESEAMKTAITNNDRRSLIPVDQDLSSLLR